MIKTYKVKVEGKTYEVEVELISQDQASSSKKSTPASTESAPTKSSELVVGTPVNTPIQGNIWKILKNEGDEVKMGDTILILEAMKMEHNITAPKDGVIVSIPVKEGDSVDNGTLLAKIS